MQCDIDILGEPSNLAEIELILATTTTLGKLGFKKFQIRINERRILKAMAAYSGFSEDSYDTVFIILDKMDKIGKEGVAEELLSSGFEKESVDKYMGLFDGIEKAENPIAYLAKELAGVMYEDVEQNLTEIIESVDKTKAADFEIVFDPTLVRGMSYYTGTIFEIAMPEFGGSCGGGGRYDNLIGKFLNEDVPAVGFSIGFERIYAILSEQGIKEEDTKKRVAVIYDAEDIVGAYQKAEELRKEYTVTLFERPKKLGKFLNKLEEKGYYGFYQFGQSEEINVMSQTK